MKFSTVVTLLAIANTVDAFVGQRPSFSVGHRSQSGALSMSDSTESEIDKLRAAAAKAREEANALAKELGKDEESAAVSIQKPKLSKEELMSSLSSIPFDANSVETQSAQLEELRGDGQLSLYKSANLRSYPVSLDMLESRTNIDSTALGFGESEVSLDDFKYATIGVTLGSGFFGVLSLAFLPPNIGSTLCYLFALIPIAFLGVGSTAPAAIANAIVALRGDGGSGSDVSAIDRVARHEAAHFMCGYLCGLPIVGYNILQDAGGVPQVEFSTGSQQAYSNEQVASLSITAMSGLVAEAMEFGDAKGAENDLLELEQIFRRAKDFIGAQQQQDLTRWGALTAYNLLSENKGKLEELVEAFKQQKSVSDCVSLLEC